MKIRISALCMALFFLGCVTVSAVGHPVPQTDKTDCSISVVLQNKQTAQGITDATLVCLRVGYVEEDNGNFGFYHTLTHQPIDAIDSAATAEAFDRQAQTTAFEAFSPTEARADGTYRFTNLKTGLYLIRQQKAADGYNDMNSFLVSVPSLVNGEYLYDIAADVKTQLYTQSPPHPSEPPEKLPQTGLLYWPVPVMAAVGLALLLVGVLLLRKRESNDQ